MRASRPGLLPRALIALAFALPSCTKNEVPSGPALIIPPSVQFMQGQTITYVRENYEANGNRTVAFQHGVEVLATEGQLSGLAGVAAVRVSSGPVGGGISGVDTAYLAYTGERLLVYDPASQTGARYPVLPPWTALLDLRLQAGTDTLLAFDSTFALTMASGHLLRDRVACLVETGYAGIGQLPAFGSPIVNCFVFTRSVRCNETVDTAGVLLFQGASVALLDTVWYADGIGPIRMSSRGNTLGLDSLGLPFSLGALRVLHTADAHRTFEVRYSRAGGVDDLQLRYGLYDIPPQVHTMITAITRSYY